MLSRWGGGRPGIGGGFDSSHYPIVGTFDRFNDLSSNILLTFSCYFDNPQMPWGGTFEQKLSAQFRCPAYAQLPPPPPQQLNIDKCISTSLVDLVDHNFNILRNSDIHSYNIEAIKGITESRDFFINALRNGTL